MDWKAKARKHKNWVEAGRVIADTLRKYPGVGPEPLGVYPNGSILEMRFDDQCCPCCDCDDDGDRVTGVIPHEMSNGEYQLRIICWLCLEKGIRALKWDKVGEDQVIRIFANHFLREDGREGAVKEIEKDLADKISQVRIWV